MFLPALTLVQHTARFQSKNSVAAVGWKGIFRTWYNAVGPVTGTGSDWLEGLPPEVAEGAQVLLLGSFPGQESLRRKQYYAHPDNLFWFFMEEILGVGRSLPYRERLERLKESGIGLWDVIKRCRRGGSLDQSISPRDMEVNDFHTLFEAYPGIHAVFLNGSLAYNCYRRRVLPQLVQSFRQIPFMRLPSSSPANRFMPLEEKLRNWREIARALGRDAGR